MSDWYRIGAGIGAEGKPDPKSDAQLKAYNAELKAELKKFIAGFPTKFSAVQISRHLDAAVIWGRKMLSKFGGLYAAFGIALLGQAPNLGPMNRTLTAAEDAANRWRSKIPLFGDGYIYEKGKNREWQEEYNRILSIHMEAASLAAQRVTHDEAKRELAADLNPIKPANIAKIATIATAVIVGTMWLTRKG